MKYAFDRNEILKDYVSLKEFAEEYGIYYVYLYRSFRTLNSKKTIPEKYLTRIQKECVVFVSKNVTITKNEHLATHIVRVDKHGELIIKEK